MNQSTVLRVQGRLGPCSVAWIASAFLCFTGWLLPASVQADAVVASYQTPGCDGAVQWTVAYELYWQDVFGRTTTKDALPMVLSNVSEFVNKVGPDSGCQAVIHVDVIDKGAAVWPGTSPPDQLALTDGAGYDSAMYRFPASDQSFAGLTANNDLRHMFSEFPVLQNGAQVGCLQSTCGIAPWSVLIMHEWLHQVVAFYEPTQGWPTDDVHGACAHGYNAPGFGCGVQETYFADMMQGKVQENGQSRGLLPADWQRDGSPAHARRLPVNTALPSISGAVTLGGYLVVANGAWTNEPSGFAIEWERCDHAGNNCGAIAGEDGGVYAPTAADIGSTIRVKVTPRNRRGLGSPAISAATPAIVARADGQTTGPGVPSNNHARPRPLRLTLKLHHGRGVLVTPREVRGQSGSLAIRTQRHVCSAGTPACRWHTISASFRRLRVTAATTLFHTPRAKRAERIVVTVTFSSFAYRGTAYSATTVAGIEAYGGVT